MVTVWVFNYWPLLLRGEHCSIWEHEGECRNTVSIRYYWYHNNTRAKSDRMWKINAKLVKGYRHIKGVDMEVGGMIEWWLLSVRSSWSFFLLLNVFPFNPSSCICYQLSLSKCMCVLTSVYLPLSTDQTAGSDLIGSVCLCFTEREPVNWSTSLEAHRLASPVIQL